jgi:hypothetical protein
MHSLSSYHHEETGTNPEATCSSPQIALYYLKLSVARKTGHYQFFRRKALLRFRENLSSGGIEAARSRVQTGSPLRSHNLREMRLPG